MISYISTLFSTRSSREKRQRRKRLGGCRHDSRDIRAFMKPYDVEAQDESTPLSLTLEQQQKQEQRKRKYAEAQRSMMLSQSRRHSQTEMSFSQEYVGFFESNKGFIFGIVQLFSFGLLSVWAYCYYFERWSIIDALYFAVCTITTIGYGDISPTNDGSRLFTCFFALYGVCILGFFVNLAGHRLMELHQDTLNMVQKRTQEQVISMFEGRDAPTTRRERILSEREKLSRLESVELASMSSGYVIFKTLVTSLPVLCITLACGVIMAKVENWTIMEGVFFSIMTASTIGYGDFSPTTQTLRAASIVLLPLMVGVFCELLRRTAEAYLKVRKDSKLNRQLTVADLINMDTDNDGHVNFGEYLSFMLVAMHKIDEDEITRLRVLFDKLDTSGDGVLDKEDLKMARGMGAPSRRASTPSAASAPTQS